MKFKVQLKDPDVLHDAIRDAVTKHVAEKAAAMDLDDEERQNLVDRRCDRIAEMAGRWFKWGEYLTVEIDTEAGTCTVLEGAP
jgi:hypothetical protein